MWVLPLIIVILILIISLVTGIILFITRLRGKQIDVLPNMPFVEIDPSRVKFTNGYSKGILRRLLPRKNDTFFLEFYPTDILQGENVPRPEIQSLIVSKEFLKTLSHTDTGSRRIIIKTLVRSKLDLPEKMRDTVEGDFESKEGQKAYLEQTLSNMIPAGDEAIAEITKQFARGQLSKIFINQLQETAKMNSKINQEDKKPQDKPNI